MVLALLDGLPSVQQKGNVIEQLLSFRGRTKAVFERERSAIEEEPCERGRSLREGRVPTYRVSCFFTREAPFHPPSPRLLLLQLGNRRSQGASFDAEPVMFESSVASAQSLCWGKAETKHAPLARDVERAKNLTINDKLKQST